MTRNAILLILIIGFGAFYPLKSTKKVKAVLLAATAVIAFKFHIFALFGARFFSVPDLPGWLLQLSSLGFAAELFFVLFLVPALAFRAVRRIFCRAWRKPVDGKIDLALLTAAFVLAGIGLYGGSRKPEIRHCRMEIRNLPPQADNFRIALLSDLHADNRCTPRDMREIVERTNALNPDLIVIVGDFVDGSVARRGDTLKELDFLHAPCGVYGVTGNHEYYSGYGEWVDFLGRHGVEILENRNVELPVGLTLAGIPDIREKPDDAPPPDLNAALAGAEHPVILLSHRPKIAPEAAEKGCVLLLSGHTHGGLFPGLRAMVEKVNGGFVAGNYTLGEMKIYVSSGTGIWGGFPIRFDTEPEITLLTLTPSAP
ncbi:MAG: metallophosphoesterase [Victivallaceae bacterium]|nr:metallophosphoesterase [Victivallaceae bacterium]